MRLFRHFSLPKTSSVKPPSLFCWTGAHIALVMSAGMHMPRNTREHENAIMELCSTQIATTKYRCASKSQKAIHLQSQTRIVKRQNRNSMRWGFFCSTFCVKAGLTNKCAVCSSAYQLRPHVWPVLFGCVEVNELREDARQNIFEITPPPWGKKWHFSLTRARIRPEITASRLFLGFFLLVFLSPGCLIFRPWFWWFPLHSSSLV